MTGVAKSGDARPLRVAAIDCGTNSVRLLVAEASESRTGSDADSVPTGLATSGPARFVELARDLRLTRLGQGVDATGEFHPDALARTFAACDEYAEVLRRFGVSRLRFVATSAARDAGNREEFFAGVRARLGVDAEVIAGEEEAELSFTGALTAAPDAASPALVMDIGGGSTELVLGAAAHLRPESKGVHAGGGTTLLSGHNFGVAAAVSLDIGSVRLRERFLASDPPAAGEIAAATAYVDGLLDASGVDIAAARTWLGVGGTATSLSAIVQGLDAYDRARVHGSVLRRGDLIALAERLLTTPVAEVLTIPTMVPGRADVICAGALIASRVATRAMVDLRVSESDILDGLVQQLLAG